MEFCGQIEMGNRLDCSSSVERGRAVPAGPNWASAPLQGRVNRLEPVPFYFLTIFLLRRTNKAIGYEYRIPGRSFPVAGYRSW